MASSAGLLYQGWIVTGFCFLVLTSVLRKYQSKQTGGLFFSHAGVGVLFSNLFLRDTLTASLLVGTGLVAAGIYLVNLQPEKVK